jgi:regulator of sirC expression with transglutaminase-like and TPR domain
VTDYLARIDELAMVASASIMDSTAHARDLARFLFGATGYRGNADNYADPRNSFLNEVLDRRLGIPITLSVLYLEVARRLEMRAEGVGMPGHFIVRAYEPDGQPVLLDPFHHGRVLNEEDCRAQVEAMNAGRQRFDPDFLAAVDARHILTRMLNNLLNAYIERDETPGLIAVLERLLVLNPRDHSLLRRLGMLCGSSSRKRRAVELLGRYLVMHSGMKDAAQVRAHMNALAAEVAQRN